MNATIYEQVAAKIIAELEKGAAPWVKPWRDAYVGGRTLQPHNGCTGRLYNGINVLILLIAGGVHESTGWATYNQIKQAGGQVRKGEKSTMIVYFDKIKVKDKTAAPGEDKHKVIPLLKTFCVFNMEQADWPDGRCPERTQGVTPEGLPQCDATIAASQADVRHGGNKAFYAPGPDYIQLPPRASFKGKEGGAHYYATAFHELTHWTGHKSRLDRLDLGRYAKAEYAFEELVAELGAAFLCASHAVNGELRHAGYLANWLRAIKDDPHAIFKASALAQKAADFILAKQEQDQTEAEAA